LAGARFCGLAGERFRAADVGFFLLGLAATGFRDRAPELLFEGTVATGLVGH
jgi:hypothetical protein